MKPLTEQFRPRRLADLRGQTEVVRLLQAKLKQRCSFAMIACGPPGIGKTSIGYAVAAELGADVDGSDAQRISTGFWLVPSRHQGIDRLEEIFEHCRYRPMIGSLWWTLVFEEADCMSREAVNYLKTRLENLPSKTIVIFTSNKPLSEFADDAIQERCLCLRFEHNADKLWDDAQALVNHAWESLLKRNHAPALDELGIKRSGRLSFRAVLAALEPRLLAELPDEPQPETAENEVAEPIQPETSHDVAPESKMIEVNDRRDAPEPAPEPVVESPAAPPKWYPSIGETVLLPDGGTGRILERCRDTWRIGFKYFRTEQLRQAQAELVTA